MDSTVLVRLKPYDAKRGHVLRRFTYRGIRFEADRGWQRVAKDVAEHLRTVRQVDSNPHSALAFDIASDDDARRIDAQETAQARPARATDDLPLTAARPVGVVTTADLPEPPMAGAAPDGGVGRRPRKDRD